MTTTHPKLDLYKSNYLYSEKYSTFEEGINNALCYKKSKTKCFSAKWITRYIIAGMKYCNIRVTVNFRNRFGV